MNKILPQKANNFIEKDFYKLMNNSNLVLTEETTKITAHSHLYLTSWMKYCI